ncbi:hypothetical protein JTB14_006503 [Gonioctena quinquepunctata]|nr:hypothetical protein JTB14_006503 [Gonioctena quinquepunctata]
MAQTPHICYLGIDSKANFPPLHPKRFLSDEIGRKLRKLTILNVDGIKCEHFFPNNKSKRQELRRNITGPHRFIIHPFSKMNCILEILFLILILLSYVTLTIEFRDTYPTFEKLLDVFWFCFMISFFFTGYVNDTEKLICIHPKKIVRHYLKTYFIFDLIIFSKTFLRTLFKIPGAHAVLFFLTIISYLVRARTVFNGIHFVLLLLRLNKFVSFAIYNFLKLVILLHLAIVAYAFGPYHIHSDMKHNHWLARVRGVYYTRHELYWESSLLIICNFFGIRHDIDAALIPILQVIIFCSIRIVGRLYTLELLAKVIALFGVTNIAESEYEHQMGALRSYISAKKLTTKLKQRILTTYEKKSRKQHFDEQEIMSNMMTEHLKSEVFMFEAKSLINMNHLLNTIPKSDLVDLFSGMHPLIFAPNDVIIKAGTVTSKVYFILSGTVAGYNEVGAEIIHLQDGDEFGVTWVMSNQDTCNMTWVAVEATEVFYIGREILSEYLESRPLIKEQFEEKLRERYAKHYHHELRSIEGQQNEVLMNLRRGKLLEKLEKRPFVEQ